MSESTDLPALVESKVISAMEADEAGDSARALQLLEHAQMLMAAIPDGQREEESFTLDREAIAAAIVSMRRKTSAKCGVRSFGVRYERG